MFLAYGLLAPERDIAHLLGANIMSLQSYADRFSDALALADYIDENRKDFDLISSEHRQFIKWKFIAIESGVIATYNAFETLRQISHIYPKSETIKKTMDENLFLRAQEIFDVCFPAMNKSVRTGIAHGAPAHASLQQHRKHIPNGSSSSINTLIDRTIQSTLHGGVTTFTVDDVKSKVLNEVAQLVMRAFDGSRKFTMQFSSVNQYDKQNPIVIPGY